MNIIDKFVIGFINNNLAHRCVECGGKMYVDDITETSDKKMYRCAHCGEIKWVTK